MRLAPASNGTGALVERTGEVRAEGDLVNVGQARDRERSRSEHAHLGCDTELTIGVWAPAAHAAVRECRTAVPLVERDRPRLLSHSLAGIGRGLVEPPHFRCETPSEGRREENAPAGHRTTSSPTVNVW